VWDPTKLPMLQEDVATTLSLFEWELLGAFFDVMTHLCLHVVEELAICGPIHARWMYPIEHALKTFKAYVQNKARLEASIVEGYIYDKTIGFVTKYMQEFKHVQHCIWDAYEEEKVCGEMLKGVGIKFILPKECHEHISMCSQIQHAWHHGSSKLPLTLIGFNGFKVCKVYGFWFKD
jgi:hypothetical protein